MNKKILAVSLCLAFLMALYGCTVKPAAPSPSAYGSESNGDAITVSEGNTDQSGITAKDYSAIGFELVKEESLFVLNNAVTGPDVIKLMGEPEEKSEAAVWGADGLEHQTWYYKAQGLEIGFIKDNSNIQTVNLITVSSPSKLKTSRGIGVGSTKSEILKAYENEINQEEYGMEPGRIVAGTVYGGLVFKLENDKVASIFIGSAAE